MNRRLVTHTFAPVYSASSRVLLLGTIPSPRSREEGFYYTHPQNRFWRVMADLLGEALPTCNDERRDMLLRHDIALWDVLASCEIAGAGDASISVPVANDIAALIGKTRISAIFTTGKKAYALYSRLCLPQTGLEAVCLPSTSPANCAVSYNALKDAYGGVIRCLQAKEASR